MLGPGRQTPGGLAPAIMRSGGPQGVVSEVGAGGHWLGVQSGIGPETLSGAHFCEGQRCQLCFCTQLHLAPSMSPTTSSMPRSSFPAQCANGMVLKRRLRTSTAPLFYGNPYVASLTEYTSTFAQHGTQAPWRGLHACCRGHRAWSQSASLS